MTFKGVFDNVLSDFIYETAKDSITALAGGGQTNATLLTSQTNRVSTVATAGDSIKLPVSAPGLELIVINSGANAMQVYGSGTDTINGVATATGVSQMANSTVIYTCVTAGSWFSEGLATGFSAGLQTQLPVNSITAFAGGGQASATALTGQVNRVSTVATAADSVKLPASAAGLVVMVWNDAALPMQVFGAGTDTINGVATATGVSQMQKSAVIYSCVAAGAWVTEGVGTGYSGALPTVSATNGITAFAGGGQGSAVALTTSINRVTTVGTAADSVKLPTSAPGMQITVINAAAANSMNVFPVTGDIINALSANTAIAVAANKTMIFSCAVAGTWNSVLTA